MHGEAESRVIVRGTRPDDLDAVLALAARIGAGMTTLKADRGALARRLAVSVASFAGAIPIAARDYLFVLEDIANGRVGGVCAIKASVGGVAPFFSYRLASRVHVSVRAQVRVAQQALHVSHAMTGAAELCSLYLHPDYRNGVNGKLLSKSRLLFIAQFPHLFARMVFAELRGVQTVGGGSPFWEGVGRHFFKMDFNDADNLRGLGDADFIAQLMPRYPLYLHMLPPGARAAIGKTHVDTAPARHLLEQEGLRYDGYIDIFDGGPVLRAAVGELRACRDSTLAVLRASLAPISAAPPMLVATTDLSDFRVAVLRAEVRDGELALPPDQRALLSRALGATLRVLPLASAHHKPTAAHNCGVRVN